MLNVLFRFVSFSQHLDNWIVSSGESGRCLALMLCGLFYLPQRLLLISFRDRSLKNVAFDWPATLNTYSHTSHLSFALQQEMD